MSNITPTTPSFVFGYWRPWKDNSNFFDSYLDYTKDVSLAKYGSDTVGNYINQASKEQVRAINQLGQAIGRGMNVLSNQMSDVNDTLGFLNRNMDIQIEQQKLSNLLLQNIAELLRVPDSEKERQHSIELGIKFFVNAKKDSDLYADSLEEFLKAESLMKQDYFVLHRIGCIYLYAEKYINPEKALDYFIKAAKYASVESDPGAVRLANALTNNFNTANSELNNSEIQIGLLAADSYEKAAFSAYVLGRFSDSVNYQAKALKFNGTPQFRFILSKYQIRNGEVSEGISNLSKSIDDDPIYAVAAFKEIDLINAPEVLNLISSKNQDIDSEIGKLLVKWKAVESAEASEVIQELALLSQKSYETKVAQLKLFEKKANEVSATQFEIDSFISEMNITSFSTIDELTKAKDRPLEKMRDAFDTIKKQIYADRIQIGSMYAGGIIFYIEETGNHGLVCSDKDFGEAVWGSEGNIGAYGNGLADGSGMLNTKKIVDQASWDINENDILRTSKIKILTAARLCLESNYNGYEDWYLPTLIELRLINETLYKRFIGNMKQAGWYWSSTEDESTGSAWQFGFKRKGKPYYCCTSFQGYNTKGTSNRVLAIRAF